MTSETSFESFELNPEFKDSAAGLIGAESPVKRLRRLRGTEPGFEKEVWNKMARAGWTAILIPEELGGLGLDLSVCGSIASAIGESPVPEPYVGAAVLPVAALLHSPASALRERLLSEILSGDTLAGLAWQETAGEIEAQSAQTGLERLESGYRLTGRKKWVAPGVGADGWLVYARLENEPVLVWVGCQDPGVAAQSETRIDGTLMGHFDFDVALAADRLIARGDPARLAVEYALDAGRFVASHELCGIARKVFTDTLQYLKTRVQFGKPIGANQALQHKMVDAYLQVMLLSASLKENWLAHRGGEITLANLASRVKARASDVAVSITRLAVQLHGAIGYTDELDIGLYLKRALNLASWLGNDNRHKERFLAEQLAQEQGREADDAPAPQVADQADLNGLGEQEFRRVIRAFLKQHYPEHFRHVSRRLYWNEIKDWYLTLSARGWLAPAWPRRFGGMELSAEKQLAFFEEMESYGAARLPDQGIINLGPVLIRYGTEAQQQEYLPRILSGEHIWCQGYSEPNSGSDLASLRTQAVPDGDDFIVNGQKIWTTLAHNANHIFALVRTNTEVKKQAGISFLLIDLATPGIRVSPIRNILGDEEFCEVFFDNVRVPRKNLVGELNGGWTIAKDLLGFERIFAGNPQQSLHAFSQLATLAQAENLLDDPEFRIRYAGLLLDVIDLQCLFSFFAQYVKQGLTLPPSVSLLKIWATETYVRIGREMALRADENGGSADDTAYEDGTVLNSLASFTHSLITTIYGGTNEIQRNIIAKNVLQMPS
jgi:alkylation response protein AidB-like acyl-CoA dehydrogenase